jgi:hypothetical protein
VIRYIWLRIETSGDVGEQGNEPSGFIKYSEIVDYLSN